MILNSTSRSLSTFLALLSRVASRACGAGDLSIRKSFILDLSFSHSCLGRFDTVSGGDWRKGTVSMGLFWHFSKERFTARELSLLTVTGLLTWVLDLVGDCSKSSSTS